MRNLRLLFLPLILLLVFEQAVSAEKKKLKFGVHPLYNPQKIIEVFGPICDLMTAKTSFECVLEPSKDYSHYNTQIKEKYYDVLMPNPLQTVKSLEYGYEIFAKWSNDELFKGIILVRQDSGIHDLSQLKGKKISFPAPTALAAALMPQFELAQKGLFPDRDYQAVYVGSQDSSILSAYNKSSDAGVTWYPPWQGIQKEKPSLKEKLKILVETQSMPNNGLVYRAKLTATEKKELSDFFLQIDDSSATKMIFEKVGIDKFESANRKTYKPVEIFLKKYESLIGKVPW